MCLLTSSGRVHPQRTASQSLGARVVSLNGGPNLDTPTPPLKIMDRRFQEQGWLVPIIDLFRSYILSFQNVYS